MEKSFFKKKIVWIPLVILAIACGIWLFSDIGDATYTNHDCRYSFLYPANWLVKEKGSVEALCSQDILIKMENEDAGKDNSESQFEYSPDTFAVEYFTQGLTIKREDRKCARQSVSSCSDLRVKNIDEIVGDLGQPTSRTIKNGVTTILYQNGPNTDVNSGFYKHESFVFYAQKEDMFVKITSPDLWPRVIKDGEKVYQSFSFLPR